MCFHFTNSDSSRSYGNSDNGRTMLKGTKRRELEGICSTCHSFVRMTASQAFEERFCSCWRRHFEKSPMLGQRYRSLCFLSFRCTSRTSPIKHNTRRRVDGCFLPTVIETEGGGGGHTYCRRLKAELVTTFHN